MATFKSKCEALGLKYNSIGARQPVELGYVMKDTKTVQFEFRKTITSTGDGVHVTWFVGDHQYGQPMSMEKFLAMKKETLEQLIEANTSANTFHDQLTEQLKNVPKLLKAGVQYLLK